MITSRTRRYVSPPLSANRNIRHTGQFTSDRVRDTRGAEANFAGCRGYGTSIHYTIEFLVLTGCIERKYTLFRQQAFSRLQNIHKAILTADITVLNPLTAGHFLVARHPRADAKNSILLGQGMILSGYAIARSIECCAGQY